MELVDKLEEEHHVLPGVNLIFAVFVAAIE